MVLLVIDTQKGITYDQLYCRPALQFFSTLRIEENLKKLLIFSQNYVMIPVAFTRISS